MEVVPLPPGTKPVNAPLFALKAFAAGTLLCAVGSSAAVLAYAYVTDTWSVRVLPRYGWLAFCSRRRH